MSNAPSHSRTVAYVLGAGFSYGTGHHVLCGRHTLRMPTQISLFEEICRHRYKTINTLDRVAQTVRRYFSPGTHRPKRQFASGYRRHEDLFGLSIEDIITFLDEFRLRAGPADPRIDEASMFFRKAITELINLLSAGGNPSRNPLMWRFVKRLLSTDVVITLNWDTLLDNALQKLSQWHPSYGYGRTIAQNLMYASRLKTKTPKKYVRLFKLHGSINWTAYHRGNIDNGKYLIEKGWGVSKRQRSTVMIPPKMIKEEIWSDAQEDPLGFRNLVRFQNHEQHFDGVDAVSSHFFPELWNESEEALSHAKKIVFIGYSFPPADFALTNLIRRAVARRKNIFGQPPEIHIVDPNVGNLAKRFENTFKIEVPNDNQALSLRSYLFTGRNG